jgi:hypothetical protein
MRNSAKPDGARAWRRVLVITGGSMVCTPASRRS